MIPSLHSGLVSRCWNWENLEEEGKAKGGRYDKVLLKNHAWLAEPGMIFNAIDGGIRTIRTASLKTCLPYDHGETLVAYLFVWETRGDGEEGWG